MTILPGETACLVCVFPDSPRGLVETCDTSGILNSAVNLVAAIASTEAVKLLVGARDKLRRTLFSYDVWSKSCSPYQYCRNRARTAGHASSGLRLPAEVEGRPHITLCGRNSVLRFPSRRARMAAVKALFNLKILFLALVALMLIGVAGFHFIEGWPWFDGFYMVLTTITTIGYGEAPSVVARRPHLQHLHHHDRRWAGAAVLRRRDAGFAGIRATIGLRQEAHGPRDQPIVGPLHHLRRRTRGPQRGARAGAQAAALRHR